MKGKKPSLIIVGAWFSTLSGCAIHPEPENFAGVVTVDIVRQIRCETREAGRHFILAELQLQMNQEEDPELKELAANLYDEYKDDDTKHNFYRFNPKLLAKFPNTYHYIDAIYNTSVAYNFDLTSAEENDLSASLNFLGPLKPSFTSGLSAAINRGRSNERTFTLTDTIGKLLTNLRNVPYGGYYCDGHVVGENYIYPISGEIGVQKSLKAFWELSIFAGVGATGPSDAAAPAAAGAAQKAVAAGKKGQSQADAASPNPPSTSALLMCDSIAGTSCIRMRR